MYAWRARDVLGCRRRRVDLIADRISRCARGPFFRFPNVRLNQINWNCELYAHLATVTGDTELLVNDYRAQVERFCDGHQAAADPGRLAQPRARATASTTCPHRPPTHPFNLDSAEYASETCHFILYYEQALRAGMAPLPPEHVRAAAGLGRAHRLRLLDARRLPELGHRLRLQALARGPHLGARAAGPARDRGRRRASTPRPSSGSGRSTCSTAAWRCTSASRARRPTARASRRRTSTTSTSPRSGPASASCSRPACRPTRPARSRSAWAAMPAAEPPPLYSFDGDIGRLTITTPTLLDRGAGRQPARGSLRRHRAGAALRRRPAGGLERRRPALGELRRAGARRRARRRSLTSQRPSALPPPRPPLRAAEVAARPRARAKPYPKRPYGGPFETLVAHGPHAGPARWPSRPRTASSRLDRDALAITRRHARPLHGRRAVSLVGQGGAASRPCSRRPAGHARRPGSAAPQRLAARSRLLLHGGRGHRLRRAAGRPPPARPSRTSCGRARSRRPRARARRSPSSSRTAARFKRLGLAMRIAPAASRQEAAHGRAQPAAGRPRRKRKPLLSLRRRRLWRTRSGLLEQTRQVDALLLAQGARPARPRRRGRTGRPRPRAAR